MIYLSDISERTLTIIDLHDPARSQVHKVFDEIKTELQFMTQKNDNFTRLGEVCKGIASKKISKELNMPHKCKSNGSDYIVLACCYAWVF